MCGSVGGFVSAGFVFAGLPARQLFAGQPAYTNPRWPTQHNTDVSTGAQVFGAIRRLMNDTSLTAREHEDLAAAALAHLKELIHVSSDDTAVLVLDCFADKVWPPVPRRDLVSGTVVWC